MVATRRQPKDWVSQDLWITALLPEGPVRRNVQRAFREGKLARICQGVYTSIEHPRDDWPALIQRHCLDVAAGLFPGAVLGWRSAFAGKPLVDGCVFLTYKYDRRVAIEGVSFVLRDGPAAAEGDMPYRTYPLHWAGQARTLLENLAVSRANPPLSAGPAAVEARLRSVMETRGEKELNAIRDNAREVAARLDLEAEFEKLDTLVSRLLATHPARGVLPPAQGSGLPVDRTRLARFDKLVEHLRARPLPVVADVASEEPSRLHFAFLESYFSNFIEGTKFAVEEAVEIALEGRIPRARPKDAHDILGVLRLAHGLHSRRATLPPGAEIVPLLEQAHADMLRARPDVEPGKIKLDANQAGTTVFVRPELVRGTLIAASTRLTDVPEGLARGILALFIVAEVHPFNDGNGRLSRLALNAELTKVAQGRVIVPTLVREEFFDTLRALSRGDDPKPLVDFLVHMQAWSAKFSYRELGAAIAGMRSCNAFEESPVHFQLLTPTGRDAPAT